MQPGAGRRQSAVAKGANRVRLLLDTHIWLDCAPHPGKLGRRLRREISSSHAGLWVSPLSAWEVLELAERGKFKPRGDPARRLDELLKAFPVHEAGLTFAIARAISAFTLPHRDPADAWLIVAARVLGLEPATRDEKIIASGLVAMLDDS